MDDDSHAWMAAGLFSPSKARQQQALAQDWLFVEEWLRDKYSPEAYPFFERNEQTLQALLSLASINGRADQQQQMCQELQCAVSQHMQRCSQLLQNVPILLQIQRSLSDGAETSLDEMAEASIALDTQPVSSETIAQSIFEATNKNFNLSYELQQTASLQWTLNEHHFALRRSLKQLEDQAFQAPSELHRQSSEWIRTTKLLKEKLLEYSERMAHVSSEAPSGSFEKMIRLRIEIDRDKHRLEDISRQALVYGDLPGDIFNARAALERARSRLEKVVQQRDRLFERLADRGEEGLH